MISDNTWNKFFDKINELYGAKKEVYTKKCIKIIEYVQKSLTKDNFEQLLNKLNRAEDIKKYELPNCCICLSEIAKGQETVLLPCGHMFHWKCCLNWLKKNNTCPMCRFEIK